MPAACAGLSRAQVNQAASTAIRQAAGSGPKSAWRKQAGLAAPWVTGLLTGQVPAPAPACRRRRPRPPGRLAARRRQRAGRQGQRAARLAGHRLERRLRPRSLAARRGQPAQAEPHRRAARRDRGACRVRRVRPGPVDRLHGDRRDRPRVDLGRDHGAGGGPRHGRAHARAAQPAAWPAPRCSGRGGPRARSRGSARTATLTARSARARCRGQLPPLPPPRSSRTPGPGSRSWRSRPTGYSRRPRCSWCSWRPLGRARPRSRRLSRTLKLRGPDMPVSVTDKQQGPAAYRMARLWHAADLRRVPLRTIITAVLVVAFFYLAGKLVYRLRDVVLLVLVAGFVAVILNPLVLVLQRYVVKRRGFAVTLVTLLALLVFLGLAVTFGWPLVNAITQPGRQAALLRGERAERQGLDRPPGDQVPRPAVGVAERAQAGDVRTRPEQAGAVDRQGRVLAAHRAVHDLRPGADPAARGAEAAPGPPRPAVSRPRGGGQPGVVRGEPVGRRLHARQHPDVAHLRRGRVRHAVHARRAVPAAVGAVGRARRLPADDRRRPGRHPDRAVRRRASR